MTELVAITVLSRSKNAASMGAEPRRPRTCARCVVWRRKSGAGSGWSAGRDEDEADERDGEADPLAYREVLAQDRPCEHDRETGGERTERGDDRYEPAPDREQQQGGAADVD